MSYLLTIINIPSQLANPSRTGYNLAFSWLRPSLFLERRLHPDSCLAAKIITD
ncbi:hypothetical protein [[Phormidium] sp. ETS-05]|uniref:hypothetical protein n=1 Tax=[Phormidium] sp. ETS-05 TaxID=222819 RepID=UPI0018EF150F|nr:hypothetical protein [[Phormidium] sp. ETS-05]